MIKPIEKNDSIQAIRGFGFLSVFLYHCGFVKSGGGFGVSLFFVLSGFLLMSQSLNNKKNYGYIHPSFALNFKYAWDKILKLYPLHIVMTLVMVPFLLREMWGSHFLKFAGKLFVNLALIQSWFPWSAIRYSLNDPSWFLSCMFFLYFVFPWIKKIVDSMSNKYRIITGTFVFILMIVIGALLNYIIPDPDSELLLQGFTYNFPIFRLGDFFIGSCMGAIYGSNEVNVSKKLYTIIEAIILIASIATIIIDWEAIFSQNSTRFFWPKSFMFIPTVLPLVWCFTKSGGVFQSGFLIHHSRY